MRRTLVIATLLTLLVPASASAGVPAPNDPRFKDQWGLHNTGQQVTFDAPVGIPGADINALEAWRWTQGAGAPPLAVIDSGIDFTHPDLAGAAWRNPEEIAGNGADDDANGHVDDVAGWNFFDDSADVTDPNGHGTGVAGIAIARSNDGKGIAGIAPKSSVMALRMTDDEGYGHAHATAAALRYAASHGARVANVSLGHQGTYETQLLAEAATDVPELLIIAAAANARTDLDASPLAASPCTLSEPNVVCVAASDARDEFAAFSNFGASTVDLAAPGADVLSPVSGNTALGRVPTFGWGHGTSMSAPLVAGTAQLLLAARPDLSVEQLRSALLGTGKPLTDLVGRTATGRRLDAAAALQHVAGPAPADPVLPVSAAKPKPTPARPVPVSMSPATAPLPVATPTPAPSPPVAGTATKTPRKAATRKRSTKAGARKRSRKAGSKKRSTKAGARKRSRKAGSKKRSTKESKKWNTRGSARKRAPTRRRSSPRG